MNQLKVDFKEFVQALFTWKYWRMLLVLALGCLAFSSVVNGILLPHHFFAGGLTGLGLLFYESIKEYIPFSLLYVLMNIPIFIIGFREFSEIHSDFTDRNGSLHNKSGIDRWL